MRIVGVKLTPNHHLYQRAAVDFAFFHASAYHAAAQNGNAVCQFFNFVQLVRNKHYRAAVVGHFAQVGKQLARFLRRQHRSRFVKYQHPAFVVQHTQNFHALLFADAKLPYKSVRVYF